MIVDRKYIATFFSHFGAIRFKKECEKKGWNGQLMPVPRNLSSSCGTCVQFWGPKTEEVSWIETVVKDEVEQIVRIEGETYQVMWNGE